MRKILPVLLLICCIEAVAQDYISTSFLNERENNVISQLDLAGNIIQQTPFPLLNPGSEPFRWVESNGSIYGICSDGGTFGQGLIFEYDYENNNYSVIADLTNFVRTIVPMGDSIFGIQQDSIFTLDLASGAMVSKVAPTGFSELEHLMLASNGLLYGTADDGGVNNDGVLYSFDPQAQTFQLVHSFEDNIDGNRVNGLIEGDNGILYGTNTRGGTDFGGTLYSFNTANNTLTVLQEFRSGSNVGFNPDSELALSNDGKLYGVFERNDEERNGIIFQYDLTNNNLNTWPLNELTTGRGSEFTPYLRSNNELIYATSDGGSSENGAIISLNIPTGQFTVLEDFELFFGAADRFIEASDGRLLGISEERVDSEIESGVIFSYDVINNVLDVKIETEDFIAGTIPLGPVVESSNQTFFGLTILGGELGFGAIYEYLPQQDTIVSRISLGGGEVTEWRCTGALSAEINGLHYGLAEIDQGDFDVLYRFDPVTNDLDTVHTFGLTVTGTGARGELVHQNGILYGEVTRGAANGQGGLFSYSIDDDTYNLIYSFESGIVGSDVTSLVIKNDKIYGTTGFDFLNERIGGPIERGILFEYDLTNNTFTTLKTFLDGSGEDDIYQFTGPLNHSNGKIYFYGRFGGASGIGGLLELDPTDNSFTEFDFFDPNNTAVNAETPRSLVEDENGMILGYFDIRDNNLTPREIYGIFTFNPMTSIFNELSPLRYPGRSVGLARTCINPYTRVQNNAIAVCLGDQLEIVLNSPNSTSYAWSKDGAVLSNENSDVLNLGIAEIADSGIYRATLTNSCGTSEIVVEVSVNEVISELTIGSVSCTGLNDGSITIDQTIGGTAPFEYSLNGLEFQTTTIFNNLSPGSYTLYSRDSIGCQGTQTLIIEEPLPLSITAGFEGIEVLVMATGGTEPYIYSSNGVDFQEPANFLLANGQYTFTVRDTNGCEVTTSEAVAVTSVEFQLSNVLFYPNPVEDIINVGSMKSSSIRIIDNRGVALFQREISKEDERISLRFLNPGIYFLEVMKREDKIHRFKLLKE